MIARHLAEASEALKKLEQQAASGELHEEQLQIDLLHVYHHLNFAWNTRRVATSEHTRSLKENFQRWGTYPGAEIEDW